jgi:hypothetical protein
MAPLFLQSHSNELPDTFASPRMASRDAPEEPARPRMKAQLVLDVGAAVPVGAVKGLGDQFVEQLCNGLPAHSCGLF